MTTYYINYGDPGPRFNRRTLLLILLGLLALLLLAGIALGVFLLVTGEDDSEIVPPVTADTAATPTGADEPDAAAADAELVAAAIPSLYLPNTNTIFLVDVSKSIADGGALPVVKQGLINVVLPFVEGSGGAENSRAALMVFTNKPDPLVPMSALDESDAQSAWLAAVSGIQTADQPAYIYDAMYRAQQELADLDDPKRASVIVLLTDGSDGGFMEIDPTQLTPCPADVPAAAGEVCRPEADAPAGYVAFDPTTVEPCPPELNAAPGQACIEVSSATSRPELIAALQSGGETNLIVHTVGLGQEYDRELLQLLAKSGTLEGLYIYAEQ